MSDSGRAGVGANTLVPSEQDEWLEADGLGGFASGTTLGLNTRRYHALLLVAVEPPAARHVLVNDAVVWLEHGGGAAGAIEPPFQLRRGSRGHRTGSGNAAALLGQTVASLRV